MNEITGAWPGQMPNEGKLFLSALAILIIITHLWDGVHWTQYLQIKHVYKYLCTFPSTVIYTAVHNPYDLE